jgi:hypothetical protein
VVVLAIERLREALWLGRAGDRPRGIVDRRRNKVGEAAILEYSNMTVDAPRWRRDYSPFTLGLGPVGWESADELI